MNSNEKRKVKNKSYIKVITSTDKLHSMCVIIMIITAIVGCVDLILTVPYIKNIATMYNYLNDFQAIIKISSKYIIYIVLILIEWFLLKIANMLNLLATTIFKTDGN